MEYRRLQTCFYFPTQFRGPATSRYLAAPNPLVRFSFHYVLKEGMSFLDIGSGIGVASALAARTPAIRITAIEPDVSMRSVLLTNLGFYCLRHQRYFPRLFSQAAFGVCKMVSIFPSILSS